MYCNDSATPFIESIYLDITKRDCYLVESKPMQW
jgi:hypothetical protein